MIKTTFIFTLYLFFIPLICWGQNNANTEEDKKNQLSEIEQLFADSARIEFLLAADMPLETDKELNAELDEDSKKNMFRIMMKKMGKVENNMDGMAAKVDNAAQLAKEATAAAQEAKVVANEAKEAAATFGGAVEDMKKAWAMKAVIKDELPAMVKGITATMVDPWAQAAGKGSLGICWQRQGKLQNREASRRTHAHNIVLQFPKRYSGSRHQGFHKEKHRRHGENRRGLHLQ